jgi:hypothetical protein
MSIERPAAVIARISNPADRSRLEVADGTM